MRGPRVGIGLFLGGLGGGGEIPTISNNRVDSLANQRVTSTGDVRITKQPE